jgi:hypothetical protein
MVVSYQCGRTASIAAGVPFAVQHSLATGSIEGHITHPPQEIDEA